MALNTDLIRSKYFILMSFVWLTISYLTDAFCKTIVKPFFVILKEHSMHH